ncbi:MAG: hypothetical protein JNG88_18155 [Phycisphaerales bacterium]|nr:hypothetical protein [Phycisphaerales bacterium]
MNMKGLSMSIPSYASMKKKAAALCLVGAVVMQLIPFGCGQPILRLVTPILLDDTFNILDSVVHLVAPLVLP